MFEIFNEYDNINFFINRKHSYSHQGRIHDEKTSDLISKKLRTFLINHNIKFVEINSTDDLRGILFDQLMLNHRIVNYQQTKKIRKDKV